MSTALERREKEKDIDEELIMGVISSAREMRRMIRKHSIEMQRNSVERKT